MRRSLWHLGSSSYFRDFGARVISGLSWSFRDPRFPPVISSPFNIRHLSPPLYDKFWINLRSNLISSLTSSQTSNLQIILHFVSKAFPAYSLVLLFPKNYFAISGGPAQRSSPTAPVFCAQCAITKYEVFRPAVTPQASHDGDCGVMKNL